VAASIRHFSFGGQTGFACAFAEGGGFAQKWGSKQVHSPLTGATAWDNVLADCNEAAIGVQQSENVHVS
jgi:hypothetical protein